MKNGFSNVHLIILGWFDILFWNTVHFIFLYIREKLWLEEVPTKSLNLKTESRTPFLFFFVFFLVSYKYNPLSRLNSVGGCCEKNNCYSLLLVIFSLFSNIHKYIVQNVSVTTCWRYLVKARDLRIECMNFEVFEAAGKMQWILSFHQLWLFQLNYWSMFFFSSPTDCRAFLFIASYKNKKRSFLNERS